MKELIISFALFSCGYFLCLVANHDWPNSSKEVEVASDPKITIHLSSGEKLHPSRAHVNPEHVQAIMPDGTAITMAWKQVESISHQ